MHALTASARRWLSWLGRQDWLRSALLCLVCLAGGAYYLKVVHGIYPPGDWLFVPLAKIWAWSAYLHLGCLAAGLAISTKVLEVQGLPRKERWISAVAVGFTLFTVCMYALGAVRLFRPWATITLPGLMLLVGVPCLRRELGELRQRFKKPLAPAHPLIYASVALSIAAAGLLYLQTLTPDALNYDSRWYHLTVGEDYAREGRLVPFYADYNKAAFPHFTALLYTWCSLLPGMNTPLCTIWLLQNEFFFFAWTLMGVGAAVEWMLSDRAPGAWSVLCLFPGVFVYDSNLGGSADHFLGFFTLPLFLAAMRTLPDLAPRACVWVGVLAGGATLVKFQAIYVIAGLALVIGVRWVVGAVRERKRLGRNLWLGPLMIVLSTVLVTLPHFLKSWIFYKNPLYPFMTGVFTHSFPLQPDAAQVMEQLRLMSGLGPKGTLGERMLEALRLVWCFSFEAHASTPRPFFGSLFSLLLPALLFLRDRRRIFLGVVVACIGVVVWANTFLVDRYLQTLSALMMAVAAALIVRVWQAGLIAKIGVSALVSLQLVWGADAYFWSGHPYISSAIALIRSGFEGNAQRRFDNYLLDTRRMDHELPKDAVLLFHNTRLSLGVRRPVYQDLPGFQSLISYRSVRNARDLVKMYRSFGITHVVHERGKWEAFTRQEEVVFAMFVQHHAKREMRTSIYEVLELPRVLPADEPTYRVLCQGIPGHRDGIYLVDQLSTLEQGLPEAKRYPSPQVAVASSEAHNFLPQVDAVLRWTKQPLSEPERATLNQRFIRVFAFRTELDVYVRRRKLP